MAKVAFQLEADEAKAVQAYLRVIDAQNKATKSVRQMNIEGKKTKQTLSGMGSVAGEIGKIAAGFLSAQAAASGVRKVVGLLISEFEDLRRKEREAADTTRDFAAEFSNIIGTWLGPGQIDKAFGALKRAVKDIPNLSFKMGKEMLAAYGAAYPEATLGMGMQAVRLGAPMVWENRAEMMKFVGELGERFPEKKMEDVFDIAVTLRKKAGKNIDLLSTSMKGIVQMMEYGIGGEEALGTMMAMLERELKPRSITTAISLLGRPVESIARRPGQRLTPRQQIQNELAEMSGRQDYAGIFRWLQENPERAKMFYGSTFAPLAPIFQPGAIQRGAQVVTEAQAADTYQARLREAQTQALVKIAGTEERRVSAVESQRIGFAEGAARGFVGRYVDELLSAMPGIGKTRKKLIEGAIEIKGRVGGDYIGAATENLEALQYRFGARQVPGRYVNLGFGFGQQLPAGPNPLYDPETARAIGQLISDIREQSAALQGLSGKGANQSASRNLQEQTELLRDIKSLMAGETLAVGTEQSVQD